MAGSDVTRRWDEMIPDALGIIFSNLSLQDVLTVVPRVCKAWGAAVAGPYCWQDIDLQEWCQRSKGEAIEKMIMHLLPRSSGSMKRLSLSCIPNDSVFRFVADHASSLHTLEIPRSEISDGVVEEVAAKFSNLTFLDLSYCVQIGARGLAAMGRHCKSLIGLKRVMHPVEVAEKKTCQDDEAHAIAATMPKLRRVEIAYLLVTDMGVLDILSQCRELKFLDMRGCWDVKLTSSFFKEEYVGLKVLGPLIFDSYEMNWWEYYSNYSDSTGYLSWDDEVDEFYVGFSDDEVNYYEDGSWEDGQGLEGLEVRFYGEAFNGGSSAAIDWPSSP